MTNTLKRQINTMIKNNNSLIDIINYLFTCDYSVFKIIHILTTNFNINEQEIITILKKYFNIEIQQY